MDYSDLSLVDLEVKKEKPRLVTCEDPAPEPTKPLVYQDARGNWHARGRRGIISKKEAESLRAAERIPEI